MDIDELRKCETREDFYNDLLMDDILGRYNDPKAHPNHKKIAVVDHAQNLNIHQIISFFEAVQKDLKVKFWIGEGTSLIIDGRRFYRSFLYSDEKPLISSQYKDGLFRIQEPVVERLDGMTIDLTGDTLKFKNDGEILKFPTLEELHKTIQDILQNYWPELDHPDIRIRDNISENPRTRWLVESFALELMAKDSREDRINSAKRFEPFVPGLLFEFDPGDYIPFAASLLLARAMNELDFDTQNKIISSLVLCFGFFDDYTSEDNF